MGVGCVLFVFRVGRGDEEAFALHLGYDTWHGVSSVSAPCDSYATGHTRYRRFNVNYAQLVVSSRPPRLRTMPLDMADDIDTSPLRNDMTRRRRAAEKTDDPINQSAIARQMGYSQGYVSRLEGGSRSLRRLSGPNVWILLRGYRYDALEIKAAVKRYGLNMPPQFAQERDDASPGLVTVMDEGSVSHPSEPTPHTVSDALEGLFSAEELRIRTIRNVDLVTDDVEGATPGARVWMHTTMSADNGRPALVKQDGVDALALWPITEPTYALLADRAADIAPMRLDPARVEFVRRVVSINIPYV